MISAKVLADSINQAGNRVTTMEIVMHRFVLAEFNTHRMFSRNSASSRAIPIEKRIKAVQDDPAIPIHWGKNQKGMQAEVELDESQQAQAEDAWRMAANEAIGWAQRMADIGIHKQIANRLLEPFLWHTAVVTATEWDNFFAQRCSPLAQPEIRVLAEAMVEALNASEPELIEHWRTDCYHLPYISEEEKTIHSVEILQQISVARCARVSYLTQDGNRDIEADLALYNRLSTARPPHASPFEHVCRPLKAGDEQRGNLIGWVQLRHEVFDA
jgi:thymidylate synthase ThyX